MRVKPGLKVKFSWIPFSVISRVSSGRKENLQKLSLYGDGFLINQNLNFFPNFIFSEIYFFFFFWKFAAFLFPISD